MIYDRHIDKTEEELYKLREVYSSNKVDRFIDGLLLILAPWHEDIPDFTNNYERFHYLNHLAETVCRIGYTTQVALHGLCHAYGGR